MSDTPSLLTPEVIKAVIETYEDATEADQILTTLGTIETDLRSAHLPRPETPPPSGFSIACRTLSTLIGWAAIAFIAWVYWNH